MHWNRLRLAAAEGHDLNNHHSKRHSSLFPLFSRHSEHVPRPSASATNLECRHSESGPRPDHLDAPELDGRRASQPNNNDGHITENSAGSSVLRVSTDASRAGKRRPFSLLRSRHASDPQLSASYASTDPDAPPVPPLNMPPRKFSQTYAMRIMCH